MSEAEPTAAPASAPALRISEIVAYALPSLPLSTAYLLVAFMLMPFTGEVLGVAPAAVGSILLFVRVWDAVSDPLAGNLSDRTRSRFGRRRPWLIASAIPLFVSILMLWAPPVLEGQAMVAWVALAVFSFYTATTILTVPYYALGAELSSDYHERTRVFAFQQGFFLPGTLIASLLLVWVLTWSGDPRASARIVALSVGSLLVLSLLFCVTQVRERSEHLGRGGASVGTAFRDVLANRHARILYVAYFIDNLGAAALATVSHYYVNYVLEAEGKLPVFLAFYVIPGLIAMPFVLKLSRRIGKMKTWRIALCLQIAAYLGLASLQPGQLWFGCGFAVLLSLGGFSIQVLAPSVQSDVVDVDELSTGERKEGAYFAVRNFVYKAGYGVGPFLVGLLFQSTGFAGHGEMSDDTILGLRAMIGIFPAIGALIAVVVLARFTLDEAEHARVRDALDARNRATTG